MQANKEYGQTWRKIWLPETESHNHYDGEILISRDKNSNSKDGRCLPHKSEEGLGDKRKRTVRSSSQRLEKEIISWIKPQERGRPTVDGPRPALGGGSVVRAEGPQWEIRRRKRKDLWGGKFRFIHHPGKGKSRNKNQNETKTEKQKFRFGLI